MLITYLGITALGTSLLASYILWSFRSYFVRSQQEDLHARTTALSESVADALQDNNRERVALLVNRYGIQRRINLRVLTPDGRLLSTSNPQQDQGIQDWSTVPGIANALRGQVARGATQGLLSRHERLYEARPMFRNGRFLGVLRMSLTLREFERQFQSMLQTILWTLVISFVVCALISVWLARSLATPIRAMRNFAVRVGSGVFGETLPVQSRDELGQLATELNRMSQRLATLDEERRRFLANVSHELRTPVSNVQVTLEALQSGADAEPELRHRFVQTAYEETVRLSRLIQDLLELGRLEAGAVALEHQPLTLASLLSRAVRAIESRLQSQNLHLDLKLPSAQVLIAGDPERLLQAIFNVLDNALKYSAPQATIAIAGRIEGQQVAVQIADQGPGISAADLPRIFEQFYTIDRSRKGGGTGLGLTIARTILEAHGGTITAASPPGGGAVITLRLPIYVPVPGSQGLDTPREAI